MQVNFSDAESYITEIVASAQEIESQIVRFEVQPSPKSNGVDYMIIRSGFRAGSELRLLEVNCGESPAGRGELDGKENALVIIEEIARVVNELGLQPRQGVFVE